MRRFITAGLLISLLIGTLPAQAAVKSGSPCKSKNATQISAGKKYTCILKNKKLVWDSGKLIETPAEKTPTAPAASKPSDSQSKTESTETVDTKSYSWSFRLTDAGTLERKQGGTSIWTLSPTRPGQQVDPIRVKAFESIKNYQSSSSVASTKAKLHFSTNVDLGVQKIYTTYFNESISFFSSQIPQNSTLEVVIATEKDDQFIKDQFLAILGNSNEANSLYDRNRGMFHQFDVANPLTMSGGGTVTGTNNPNIYVYAGAVCSCFKAENVLMFNVPHEVTHYYQFSATPNVRKQNFTGTYPNLVEGKIYIPSTLIEGSANTLGSALTVKYSGWYSDQMDWHVGRYKRDTGLMSIPTTERTVELMRIAATYLPEKTGFADLNYPLGQLMFEYFIATYGMSAYLDLFANIQKLGDFDSAMRETVKISEDAFYSEAAPYVMKAYNKVTL